MGGKYKHIETRIFGMRESSWSKIYKLTEKFPKQEMYGIVSQMRRSVISIPSNVAEGFNLLKKL